MKIFNARQLSFATLLTCALSAYGQIDGYNPNLHIKNPELYHPNDQLNELIYTRLTPVHPDSVYQLANNMMQDSIVDNDGNMYVTVWDLGEKSSADFLAEQKICHQKIYTRMILDRAFDVSEIREEDIKPSVFKDHGTCIKSSGYTLREKNGFSPDKFKLNIFRSHLKSSTYMPVGAIFYLSKKSARYIDTFKSLNDCSAKAKKLDKGGLVEEYSDAYTYVSIKPYVDSVESCMKDAGYRVEKLENENP